MFDTPVPMRTKVS